MTSAPDGAASIGLLAAELIWAGALARKKWCSAPERGSLAMATHLKMRRSAQSKKKKSTPPDSHSPFVLSHGQRHSTQTARSRSRAMAERGLLPRRQRAVFAIGS